MRWARCGTVRAHRRDVRGNTAMLTERLYLSRSPCPYPDVPPARRSRSPVSTSGGDSSPWNEAVGALPKALGDVARSGGRST